MSDSDLEQRLRELQFRKSSQEIGGRNTEAVPAKRIGVQSKFTDHLNYTGMYKNSSLSTTADRDRYINGSRDWMDKLN